MRHPGKHGRPYHTYLLDEVRSIAGLGSHHRRLVESLPRAKYCKAKKPLQETCKGYTRLCQVPSGSWDGAKMATLKQSHHQRHNLSHRIRCLHSHQQQVPNAHQEHIENGSLWWGVAACSIAQSQRSSNHQCQRLTCVILVSHQS